MTDDEIVDAVRDKHGIAIATGIYRQAHLDLVTMARADERAAIVAWLRTQDDPNEKWSLQNSHWYAAEIEAGAHSQ